MSKKTMTLQDLNNTVLTYLNIYRTALVEGNKHLHTNGHLYGSNLFQKSVASINEAIESVNEIKNDLFSDPTKEHDEDDFHIEDITVSFDMPDETKKTIEVSLNTNELEAQVHDGMIYGNWEYDEIPEFDIVPLGHTKSVDLLEEISDSVVSLDDFREASKKVIDELENFKDLLMHQAKKI